MRSARPTPAAPDPGDGDLEEVRCNCCGADDADTVYEARASERAREDSVRVFRASGDELLLDRLVRCRRCGLEYVSPRLRSALIVDAYSAGEDPHYVSQIRARERTFSSALARIERLAGHRGRLLDVGTAAGAFLAAARARGWNVDGCEPNRWMAAWGSQHYGLQIRAGEIFDQDLPLRSFDVITLWDVIEHTPDPSRVIEHVTRLLKPGGLLVVNYPDRGSWLARALGRRWPFLSSVHLYYFNRRTMTRLLNMHGLSVIDIRPHVQRLELDYLLMRGSAVSAALSRVLRPVARATGLSRRQVPYWLGQTFVAARLGAVVSVDERRVEGSPRPAGVGLAH
jgi:SAM-dependent methyltransferase